MNSEIYANGFSIVISGLEARIQFKSAAPVLDENGDIKEIVTNDVANIVLNPALLKQMAASINETVKQHESKFGEIVIPDMEGQNG